MEPKGRWTAAEGRTARRRVGTGSAGGGIAARRAVARWAWRLFRREWRQQVLVLALLTVAVAVAITSAAMAYNTAAASDDADFGTANHLIRFDASGSGRWREGVTAAEEWFGTVEVIRHWYESVPGSVEDVEFRAQDPGGAFGASMLTVREGRYPQRPGEVAVTDWVAETFELGLGSVLHLDGVERAVVGLVENPNDLQAEFALVPPTDAHATETVTLLVRASPDRFDAFPATTELTGDDGGKLTVGSRAGNADVLAAVAVLGVVTLALLLVALIASAGFAVVAQRRLRQLGMLGAIGATERQLRLVMVANGIAVGTVAAVAGVALGLAGWLVVEPRLEDAASHRIDVLNVPWWLVATASLLAVATATGAAWWPARAAARVPITRALSGRPPRPTSLRSSTALAGGLLAIGIVCLARSDGTSSLLVVTGTVTTVVGLLLVGPLAIRGVARVARWLPVAVRLALRDLARYQARSGMALAAISLVLGVPVAVVVTAAAAEPRAGEGNLADDQLLVRMGDPDEPDAPCPGPVQAGGGSGILGGGSGPCPFIPERTPADLAGLEARVGQIADELDDPSVVDLEVAYDPDVAAGPDGREAVTLAQEMGGAGDGSLLDISLLYVATPELLAYYGVELGEVDPGAELLTVESGELWFAGLADRQQADRFRPQVVGDVQQLDATYSSLPGSLVTRTALRRHDWETAPAGWLLDAGSPLTSEQFDTARDLAAESGLIVEARDEREGLAALRTRATAAGVVLALAVLAMTVGLIRTEATGDLRTLTATGATSTIRRSLTASTAGTLALLGAGLGGAGAYLALIAGYVDDVGTLSRVPVVHLAVIAVGLPLIAALSGWLLAGREPPTTTRQPIE